MGSHTADSSTLPHDRARRTSSLICDSLAAEKGSCYCNWTMFSAHLGQQVWHSRSVSHAGRESVIHALHCAGYAAALRTPQQHAVPAGSVEQLSRQPVTRVPSRWRPIFFTRLDSLTAMGFDRCCPLASCPKHCAPLRLGKAVAGKHEEALLLRQQHTVRMANFQRALLPPPAGVNTTGSVNRVKQSSFRDVRGCMRCQGLRRDCAACQSRKADETSMTRDVLAFPPQPFVGYMDGAARKRHRHHRHKLVVAGCRFLCRSTDTRMSAVRIGYQKILHCSGALQQTYKSACMHGL